MSTEGATTYLCFEANGSFRFSTLEERLWVKAADDNVLAEIPTASFDPLTQTIVWEPTTGSLTVSPRPEKIST